MTDPQTPSYATLLLREFARLTAVGIPETLAATVLASPDHYETFLFLSVAWGWKARRAAESVRRYGPVRYRTK